jgi:hypothetical protein
MMSSLLITRILPILTVSSMSLVPGCTRCFNSRFSDSLAFRDGGLNGEGQRGDQPLKRGKIDSG